MFILNSYKRISLFNSLFGSVNAVVKILNLSKMIKNTLSRLNEITLSHLYIAMKQAKVIDKFLFPTEGFENVLKISEL